MAKNDPQAHNHSIPQDDFKLITGINQGIENRLHKAGIQTYAQLASLTPQKILLKLETVKGYTVKRIEDEDWIGQARQRSKQGARPKAPRKTAAKQEIHQHYENFTIEFLLDEKNVGRRTRVLHIQSGDADTWAGWEPDQLVSFLARHAGISLPRRKESVTTTFDSVQGVTTPAEQLPSAKIEVAEPIPVQKSEEKSNALLIYKPSPHNMDGIGQSPAENSHPRPALSEETKRGAEKIHLLDWKIFPQGKNVPSHILDHDQFFEMRLMLSLSPAMFPGTSDLKSCATIYAKKIGTRNRQSIGVLQSIIPVSNNFNLQVNCVNLSPGIYRLEALLALEPIGNEIEQMRAFKELLECGLFQVY